MPFHTDLPACAVVRLDCSHSQVEPDLLSALATSSQMIFDHFRLVFCRIAGEVRAKCVAQLRHQAIDHLLPLFSSHAESSNQPKKKFRLSSAKKYSTDGIFNCC
jgi:hypothetical protein